MFKIGTILRHIQEQGCDVSVLSSKSSWPCRFDEVSSDFHEDPSGEYVGELKTFSSLKALQKFMGKLRLAHDSSGWTPDATAISSLNPAKVYSVRPKKATVGFDHFDQLFLDEQACRGLGLS